MEYPADITDDPSDYCSSARDLQLAMGGVHRLIDGRLVERVADMSHIEGAEQVEHMFFLRDRRIFASNETALGQPSDPLFDIRKYRDGETGNPKTSRDVYTDEKMLAKIVP
jgi:hypothetical protein